MKRLHSKATFFWKYVFPWIMIVSLILFFFITIYLLVFPVTIAIVIFGIVIVGLIKNTLMNIKFVYLDEVNGELIVKHKGKKIPIKIANIKAIDKMLIGPTLLDIKLREESVLGRDFVFMPTDTFLFWSQPENRLNELIKKNIR